MDRLVVIPLSFLRRLDSLKYTSVVALISIGYLVILVVYHFAKGDTMADRGAIRVIRWGGLIPTLQSFPVIVFAYTCHQNVGAAVNSRNSYTDLSRCSRSWTKSKIIHLKGSSFPFGLKSLYSQYSRTTSVIAASIGSAASVYILVAITGYLSFGNSVVGNIVGMCEYKRSVDSRKELTPS